MTNEELIEQLRRIAQNQNSTNEEILRLAAERIREMSDYCLELGIVYGKADNRHWKTPQDLHQERKQQAREQTGRAYVTSCSMATVRRTATLNGSTPHKPGQVRRPLFLRLC